MRDVVVVVSVIGFFALCVAYVALCDRIVGPDDLEPGARSGPEPRSASPDAPSSEVIA